VCVNGARARTSPPSHDTHPPPLRGAGLPLHVLTVDRAVPTAVAVAPDGSVVAAGWDDGAVRLWAISDGPPDNPRPKGLPKIVVVKYRCSVKYDQPKTAGQSWGGVSRLSSAEGRPPL